jgi:hypothetical protein
LFGIIFQIFNPLLIYLLQQHGTKGIAEAYLYSNLIIWPINCSIAMRLVRAKFLQVFAVLWRPLIASFAMFTTAKKITFFLMGNNVINNSVGYLAVLVVSGVVIYSISILCCWLISRCPEGAESFLLKKFIRKLKRRYYDKHCG